MHINAEVPEGRVNLVQLLPSIKQLSSNIINAVASGVQEAGSTISCRAGCGACCRQMVPVTFFEAEELGNWIRTLPMEQQTLLERRFTEGLMKLKSSGVLDRLDFRQMPEAHSQEALGTSLQYLHVGVPCPFLQDESCSIHPIRPLVCREYLVTSPAEFCSNPTRETVRPVPMPVELSSAMASLSAELTAEKQGWMPLIFLFAFLRSGTKVAHAYEGTGPDLLRLLLGRIAVSDEELSPKPVVG